MELSATIVDLQTAVDGMSLLPIPILLVRRLYL